MSLRKKFNPISCSLMLFSSIAVNSVSATPTFTLDTLFKTSNENGNASFTLRNTQRENVFVKGEVLQVKVVDGEIKKIPLTRDNFPLWDLAINPAKLRLLPGEVRDVAVKYLCQKDCDRTKDLVYQIRFSPIAAPSDSNEQRVDIGFGMAPYYIIPALDPKVTYEWNYDEEKHEVRVNNTGNTYLKIEVDNCNNKLRTVKNCVAVYNVLAGRVLDIDLPDTLKGKNVRVTVADHDQRYQDEFSL
ncbi:conserved exported hypothetical protein [Vibrio owensii]|uniref:Molecular chaperone n=1 Tax=Vibrio owensii TaxID=696485 RepID=A0AAU9Q7U4_9VIBR|nr:conserved exported hypothetical protein [Vibrio owensii]